MGIKLARGIAVSTSALLILGLTACAASTELPSAPADDAAVEQPAAEPETSTSLSLAEAQADIPWPDKMTLPIPEGMSFNGIESHYACDGTILGVLVSSPDATEATATSYLEGIQDRFNIPTETREGHGQDSLWDRDSDKLKQNGSVQDYPSAADATQIVSWEQLPEGGFRFNLQEVSKAGIPIHVENTPLETWMEFPHPEAPFEDCEGRESSGYREGNGFTPASTTWTLKGSPVMQPQIQEWMEGLAADGWGVKESDAMPGAGMPEARLTSEDYTAHYSMSGDYLTLFVSDRNLDKFLGL